MRSSGLSDVWWDISFSLGQLKQMEEARAWPHRGGAWKNPGWSDAMGHIAMNYWCRLRLRSPWVQGGGLVYCLSGWKWRQEIPRYTVSCNFSFTCTQWENISSDYRSVASTSENVPPVKKKGRRVSAIWEISTSPFHISEHRSAKEAWPNPCDCDFMDKHLSSATLELCCHHKRVGGKCLHQSMRKSRNSKHPARSHARFREILISPRFSAGFDMVKDAIKAITAYFISQNWLWHFRW